MMSVEQEPPVSVYTAASRIRQPALLVREMVRDLGRAIGLGWRLALRDIRARYRQSYFGLAWAFLPPLVTAGVFIFLNAHSVIQIPATDVPYPVFVMFGTILWSLFVESLNAPLTGFGTSRAMLGQTRFPKEAILVSGLLQVLFNLGIKMVILAGVMIAFKVPATTGIALALLITLMLILLGTAIGLLLMPLGMLYTDVSQGITLITTLWFFLTPVIYPPAAGGVLALITRVNPVAPLLVGARDAALKGFVLNPEAVAIVSGGVVFAFLLGWLLMQLAMPILVERMGA
jgi:lipopolysaccharide transport system permease protein